MYQKKWVSLNSEYNSEIFRFFPRIVFGNILGPQKIGNFDPKIRKKWPKFGKNDRIFPKFKFGKMKSTNKLAHLIPL